MINPLQSEYTIDFGKNKDGMDWIIINDGVMGGLSESSYSFSSNSVIFKGDISLANNGGFASMRTPIAKYDLSEFRDVEIRYRTKGRDFSLVLKNQRQFFLPNYQYTFNSKPEKWKTFKIPLLEFKETRLSNPTGNKIPKEILKDIIEIVIILNDKQSGPFEIEIDYIKFS